MGLFKEIAEPLVRRGVPVIPLRPRTKTAFLGNWQELATIDSKKIEEWDAEYPDANGACVARPDGVWFLEIDRDGYLQQIEKETGQKIPLTFMVRSSPGRGHFYFKQTDKSIAMGNVKVKDEHDGTELFSARVHNAYVVAPGSYHPTSGLRYDTLRDIDIIPAPDWLVDWCVAKRGSSVEEPSRPITGHIELDDDSPIKEGGRNNTLCSILGKARQVLSMTKEQLYEYGLSVNRNRCFPPLPDSEVRTIANSVGGYAVKESGTALLNGREIGAAAVEPAFERLEIPAVPYPKFPIEIMKGTSLYDGLVAPVCAVNSRYPEFMFMPAMVVMLNYLALKVQIIGKESLIPSFYMVSIGRKGRVIKSSSVNDAIKYLSVVGIVKYAGGLKNAEGKSLVWTAGSTEGLGLEMGRTNCKNAVLFYDELSTLVSKAGVESSSLKSNLLTMYESGLFSNTIKSRKETFSFEPGTYCTSLIACTTDKNFHAQWANMSGGSSGLDERFFFLYQPEILVPLTPYKEVNTVVAASKTKALIDKAVNQGKFSIVDETVMENEINKLGNRTATRVDKMALYFAVDMGKTEIDESCVERAMAIAKYELAVKNYLAVFESKTDEGKLQNEIIQFLQRNAGACTSRELDRALHPMRYGTYLWNRAYNGLVAGGYICENGSGVKGEPKQIVLMRLPEKDDD
jgi:hypothetical protein